MSAAIQISTGARLHFGFFAHAGQETLRAGAPDYGGVGLMIDSPGFVLAASADKPDQAGRHDTSAGGSEVEASLYEVRCNLKNARAAESGPFAAPPVEVWQQLEHRALKFIERYRTHRSRGNRPPPSCKLELRSAIPSHRGLGAGTQLGLAVGKALSL